MKARDVMNSAVVAVRPDTPINDVARTLRDHAISAVPVVDDAGSPVGMVSEGDLIGRDEADREARRDWWLSLLAEGEPLNPEFLASVRSAKRQARDVMVAPVVAVGEETRIDEVARLLTAHRIKHVPVLRDGRIVGIVSRADLVRALAETKIQPTGSGAKKGTVGGVEQRLVHREDRADLVRPAEPPQGPDEIAPMAGDFRQLMADHERQEALHREEHRRAAAEQSRRKVTQLIDHHIRTKAGAVCCIRRAGRQSAAKRNFYCSVSQASCAAMLAVRLMSVHPIGRRHCAANPPKSMCDGNGT